MLCLSQVNWDSLAAQKFWARLPCEPRERIHHNYLFSIATSSQRVYVPPHSCSELQLCNCGSDIGLAIELPSWGLFQLSLQRAHAYVLSVWLTKNRRKPRPEEQSAVLSLLTCCLMAIGCIALFSFHPFTAWGCHHNIRQPCTSRLILAMSCLA